MSDLPPCPASPDESRLYPLPELFMRSMLQDAPVGIAVKSPEGRYLWANEAAARLLGVSMERIAGATDAALFPSSLAQRLRRCAQHALARRAPFHDEFELGSDGVSVHCRCITFPLHSPHGGASALGLLLIDQSSAYREVEALRKELASLEQINRDLHSGLQELDRLAGTDKLTAAWNRRRLDEAVRDEMHRLERYRHPVSALVLDIDSFKAINDTHGHDAGDRVLVQLSELLRRNFRRSDSLTRWGGEEFIVLCPSTGLSMATLLAERLRKAIALAAFPGIGPVTVSIGVAECMAGETWEQWFQRADAALLQAKQHGRNRVHAASGTMSPEWALDPVTGRFLHLTWRSVYTSGHPLIDQQHRMLFEQSNQLLEAVLEDRPDGEIETAFEALIAGVHDHFRDEEAILRRSGYDGVDAHAAVHRELYASTSALLEKFRTGALGVGELFEFLARDVIAKHLLGADRDFFPSVGRASVGPAPEPPRLDYRGR